MAITRLLRNAQIVSQSRDTLPLSVAQFFIFVDTFSSACSCSWCSYTFTFITNNQRFFFLVLRMLENAIFYSSLAYNVVLNKLQYRRWYDRIDQSIILGALPFRGKSSKMVSIFLKIIISWFLMCFLSARRAGERPCCHFNEPGFWTEAIFTDLWRMEVSWCRVSPTAYAWFRWGTFSGASSPRRRVDWKVQFTCFICQCLRSLQSWSHS